jgi:hypothetical protein
MENHMPDADKTKKPANTRGPKPLRVSLPGGWEDAADRMLRAKKPKGGWPTTKKRRKKKAKA